MPKKKLKKKKSVRIRPIMAVLCDDIREETSGKEILIGVYKGTLTVGAPPPAPDGEKVLSALILSLWVPIEIKEAGEVSAEFRVVNPDNAGMGMRVKLKFDKVPPPSEIFAIKFVRFGLHIENEGDIKILFRHEEDEDWETLRTIPVKIKASSSESEQPL